MAVDIIVHIQREYLGLAVYILQLMKLVLAIIQAPL